MANNQSEMEKRSWNATAYAAICRLAILSLALRVTASDLVRVVIASLNHSLWIYGA